MYGSKICSKVNVKVLKPTTFASLVIKNYCLVINRAYICKSHPKKQVSRLYISESHLEMDGNACYIMHFATLRPRCFFCQKNLFGCSVPVSFFLPPSISVCSFLQRQLRAALFLLIPRLNFLRCLKVCSEKPNLVFNFMILLPNFRHLYEIF